jgi:hypothetical protein
MSSNPRTARLCYPARGHICKLYIHYKNETIMQLSLVRINPHDPSTWKCSVTLTESNERINAFVFKILIKIIFPLVEAVNVI